MLFRGCGAYCDCVLGTCYLRLCSTAVGAWLDALGLHDANDSGRGAERKLALPRPAMMCGSPQLIPTRYRAYRVCCGLRWASRCERSERCGA